MNSKLTIAALFDQQVQQRGAHDALLGKRDGQFHAITWAELGERVYRLAAGLVDSGVNPGDRVVQLSENRVEWVQCDLAIQAARAIHVPIHAPLTAEQVAFQIIDSGAKAVFVSNLEQAQKLAVVVEQLPDDLQIFSFEDVTAVLPPGRVRSWNELFELPTRDAIKAVRRHALDELSLDAWATILYTSGTTGEPKGVVLTQKNLVTNAVATIDAVGCTAEDRRLVFLPLSHIFARTCDMYTWVASGSEIALAESRDTVLSDCCLTRPNLMSGVPLFFDRIRRALEAGGKADEPGILQATLGGNVRMLFSGGAALPGHVFDFFSERELPICQGYGLTETSPVISVSSDTMLRRGASGKPVAGVEVKIADDGEILTRGPHVMVGYYKRPDATAEVIRDGWFHTGDLGHLDEDQFLFITGRKKEIIVTTGGKNIAPVALESRLCEDPLIAQALVVGDDRDFIAALIVPDPEALKKAILEHGISVTSPAEALVNSEVISLYEQAISQRLADVSRFEQIRKFVLLGRGFTIESGEMTPKFSLRRPVIEANFAEQIEALYHRV